MRQGMDELNAPEVSTHSSVISITLEEKQKIINEIIKDIRKDVREEVTKELTDEIRKDIWKWARKWSVWILGIVGLLSFLFAVNITLPRVYEKAEKHIEDIIKSKFAEANIQNTLQAVAAQQAKTIILQVVEPEAQKAKKYLDKMRLDFQEEYAELAKQIRKLKERDELSQLADDAIANANRSSYEKLLERMQDKNIEKDIANAVTAYLLQVKLFYIGTSRFAGDRSSLQITIKGLTQNVKINNISTEHFAFTLLNHSDWFMRGLAARFLADRKEKGIPEVLLKAAQNEQDLSVLKEILNSFGVITGYQYQDVFDYKRAANWWRDQKVNIESDLK